MARNVLKFNVVIVGRFFNKGSLVSYVWKKERPKEILDEPEGQPERTPTSEERIDTPNRAYDSENAVCGLRSRRIHTAFG